jgi:hypothetical protein
MEADKILRLLNTTSSLEEYIRKDPDYFTYSDSEKKEIKEVFSRRGSKTTRASSSDDTLNLFSGLSRLLSTQKQQYLGYEEKEMSRITDLIGILENPGRIKESIFSQFEIQLQQEASLHTKINEEIGMHGSLSRDFRGELIDAYPHVLRLGYGMEQLGEFAATMMKESGRFNIINQDTIKNVAAVSRAFVGDIRLMGQYLHRFTEIGIGASDAAESIEKAGTSSLQLGLNSKKTTEMLMSNIGKLNEFGFKNGIEGLNRMVQKSIEFRTNLDDTFRIAEKVWSPEGAIEMSANLQVIGGAIGSFNDPLRMMYLAVNDVEQLQEALIGSASSLATYNEEQGKFEVSGINLRRAKDMAKELGMSLQDLSKMSIASAERMSASSYLMSRGLNLSDEEKEFITNMSQMKDGEMVIELPQKVMENLKIKDPVLKIKELTEPQITELTAYRKEFVDKYKTSEDIARGQLNVLENINRDVSFIMASIRTESSSIIRTFLESINYDQKEITGVIDRFTTAFVKGQVTNRASDIIKWTKQDLEFFNTFSTKNINEKMGGSPPVNNSLPTDTRNPQQSSNKTINTTAQVNVTIAPDSNMFVESVGRAISGNKDLWREALYEDIRSYTQLGF